ncbi:hypothetical protein HY480_04505 [Candidatus Uhrbacteria bacterium]|nr:hypothetical protein [Candidatus Uhrbacteria bacterium]
MRMARQKKRRVAAGDRDLDPRTPFHQLPGDLLLTTARRLGELGLNAELADAIRRPASEAIVRQHLHDLSEMLWPQRADRRREAEDERRERQRLIHGLFTPPEQQLANVRQWMAQRLQTWRDVPFEQWFASIGPAPAWPDGKFQCVVLELALPDQPKTKDAKGKVIPAVPGYIRTVRDLWDIISGQHPYDSNYLPMDAEHLFLLDGATYEPGLRWRILDLGANWDIAPATVCNPTTSPNVDGFAAIAQHPQFICRIDGVTVPGLWIAGFQVAAPQWDERRHMPFVLFAPSRRVLLSENVGDNLRPHRGSMHPHMAVPSRLGV